MGAEQSNNNKQQTQQMSEADVKRLLEAQRRQYEKKCQEMVAKATAQNTPSVSVERERAPYSYSGNNLPAQPLYPNLNHAGPSTSAAPVHSYNQTNSNPFQTVHNNPFRPENNNPYTPLRPQDFVFVNNNGNVQPERFRFTPAPTAPCAPPPARGRGGGARPRSVSRPRSSPRERDVFDCPTCESRFGLKIFQCSNGHSSCNDCKISGRPCGICRQGLIDRRNYDLESHIAQTKAPCPHFSEGCKLHIKIADMEAHVKECPFKEHECPLAAVFGNCRWKGKLDQISNHFDSMHPGQRQTDVDSEMHLTNIFSNSQQMHLVVLGVYNFLVHLKVSETDGNIYMTVQLIGTKMSAEKWMYEIHVYNKNENRRKYMYTDNCGSNTECVDDIFKERECAVLPKSYAATFVNNGVLTYKFFIKKTNDARKPFNKNQRGREESVERKEQEVQEEERKSRKKLRQILRARQWRNSNCS